MDEREHKRRREEERDEAVVEIDAVLGRLEAERRNPDYWERGYLVHALATLFAGLYSLAVVDARSALIPHAERGDIGPALDPPLDKFDLATLRRVLQAARSEPVRLFPSFGRIELQ